MYTLALEKVEGHNLLTIIFGWRLDSPQWVKILVVCDMVKPPLGYCMVLTQDILMHLSCMQVFWVWGRRDLLWYPKASLFAFVHTCVGV